MPLAFHVDYWDYIGWKDRFGKPEFALRQREAVVRQGGRTAYTPQVIVDGHDQLGWQYQTAFRSQLRTVAARTPRADLSVDATLSNTGVDAAVTIAIPLSDDRKDAQLFLAITENNLTSTIIAGENKGLKHRHDHVVRELIGPFAIRSLEASNGSYSVRRVVPIASDWKRNDLALVAFVQDAKTGESLQALRLPVCKE